MKYFFIFSMLAFLAVMFYMDLLRYMVASDYWEGLSVVAIVMGAEIFKGIYFNLSFWYKLTDETQWGAYFSLIGCGVIHGFEYLAGPDIRICSFRVGFGSRIWFDNTFVLFYRSKEVSGEISFEGYGCLSGSGCCTVCCRTGSNCFECYSPSGLPYGIAAGLCRLYREKGSALEEYSGDQSFY